MELRGSGRPRPKSWKILESTFSFLRIKAILLKNKTPQNQNTKLNLRFNNLRIRSF